MKSNEYKVLITASGVGSGLGDLTKYTNKTLVAVGVKPVIAHIIESYPKETQFVITLGHFGEYVKDFVTLAYPDGIFEFINVDRYEGEGSSLGYSLLTAEHALQLPFIYHASDTIVTDRIPPPAVNWIGGFNGEGSSNYTSFNIINSKIQKIMEKGIVNPDFLHIGLVGVFDYKQFWKSLRALYQKNSYGDSLSDIHVWNDLLSKNIQFSVKEFTAWFDTGNIASLKKTQESLSGDFYNLEKPKESIFILDKKKVIKFHFDEEFIAQRVKRAEILKGLVPQVKAARGNFFTYNYIKGDLYADVITPLNFKEFLQWTKKTLWKPVREVSNPEFQKICFDFYYHKTSNRIKEFLHSRSITDSEDIINEEKIPSLKTMLGAIDFEKLANADQTNFHGDLILDNIIKTKNGFSLLDWRQNFGGLLKAGDLYYDLAKLQHNLIINHKMVINNFFTIDVTKDTIICDILRKENLVQCQKVLEGFIAENRYNKKKVNILTSLVWFNSAPLHHYPYDHFLFYFAKMNLWRTLNEK